MRLSGNGFSGGVIPEYALNTGSEGGIIEIGIHSLTKFVYISDVHGVRAA